LLNDQWVIEEIREEIKKFLEFNENENTTYQKLWDTAKAVVKGKFKAISTDIKKIKLSRIDNEMVHLELLEKTRTS
jgi:hypothetical protein